MVKKRQSKYAFRYGNALIAEIKKLNPIKVFDLIYNAPENRN